MYKNKIFESSKARENFEDNNTIDLREFRKGPIQKTYDSLCGITSVRNLYYILYVTYTLHGLRNIFCLYAAC